MKFFVPSATNEKDAESTYEMAKQIATQNFGQVLDRRIQSITFRDKGKVVRHAEVGKVEPLTGETVVTILESTTTFLVYTPTRGFAETPILVGKHEVTSVTDFD